jgi:molybdopterin-guanine dinucleotide biosynthesis protein A
VQPIGALLAGGLAKRFGAPMTLAIFGGVCLVGSLLFAAWVLIRVKPAQEAARANG